MAITSLLNPEVLSSSQERWRRWEQLGRDNDARFMRRLRRGFWSGVIVTTAVLVFALLY